MTRIWKNERFSRRGFILIVVVGLLAVLLALVVGFMSLTRTQVASVSHLRDKTDAMDLAQSSMDWAIANIGNYLIDPSTQRFDQTKWVSNANDDTNTGGGQWWYTPYDPQVKTLPSGFTSGSAPSRYIDHYMQQKDAKWKYLPADFFPDGSSRGRFCVQVVDANAAIAINDWLEDGNPTQCQMAHMMMDSMGINNIEGRRATLDGTSFSNMNTLRYMEGWRMASRTVRYWKYTWSFGGSYQMLSPNWITTNTTWQGLWGPEFNSWKHVMQDEATEDWYYQVGMGCHTVAAGCDPDTGRCPVNVNTCEISGNNMPFSGQNNTWAFTLEGVFNVESLARIIKVGKFWFNPGGSPPGAKILLDAQADPSTWVDNALPPQPLTSAQIDSAMLQIEELQNKLAYWYQETMVRYFIAHYRPGCYGHDTTKGSDGDFRFFRRGSFANYNLNRRSYYQAFGYSTSQGGAGALRGALTTSEARKVKYAFRPTGVTSADTANQYNESDYYKTTRFPVSLETFRAHLAEDLITMSTNNNAWSDATVVDAGYPNAAIDEYRYDLAGQTAAGVAPDGELTVNFDKKNTPEIIPGKIDKRTASAIFDNAIPGKTWKDTSGATKTLLYPGHPKGQGVSDPLTELYNMRVGRDEYALQKYNRRFVYKSATARSKYNEKGLDICVNAPSGTFEKSSCAQRAQVPWRQLCFGPDSFSTELTTTSTTFWLVVTTEVVDAGSVVTNPTDPNVRTWYQAVVVVEIAPDVIAETDDGSSGSNWPTTGLGYYRGQWPRHIKSTVNRNDFYCMDNGMKTASQIGTNVHLPCLPETTQLTMNPAMSFPAPPSGTGTSVGSAELLNDSVSGVVIPERWIDYRGVSANALDSAAYDNDTQAFYRVRQNPNDASDRGRQTSKRVVIRRISTLNQGM